MNAIIFIVETLIGLLLLVTLLRLLMQLSRADFRNPVSQAVVPPEHWSPHTPPEHTVPWGQAFPHSPQFAGSCCTSTQKASHCSVSAGHALPQTP